MLDAAQAPLTIVCTTTSAAAEVLVILFAAHLRPGRKFRISPHLASDPPVTFTITTELAADVLRQLHSIPETTIT